MEAVKIGLIGCGVISGAYLKAAQIFPVLELVACADIDPDASARSASEFGIPAMSVDDLLGSSEIELVLNLTIPAAHAQVNAAALEAGKHVYCEKPFALNTGEGRAVLDLASRNGLRTGCAPDTFLGGGHQTARSLIDANAIGRPVAGTAFMMNHGHESWHPAPEFYYAPGGGPLFDMGPYYLTALIHLLGPVKRVAGVSGRAFKQRVITSKPKSGKTIDVDVDTHVAGTLEFHCGAIVTVVMSFDVWLHTNSFIEIHGSSASLSVPDPNQFGGSVRLSGTEKTWKEQDLTHGYTNNMRSIGLADMCTGIRTGRPHRCDGELAYHVLEVMESLLVSSNENRHIEINSRPKRPEPLRTGLTEGELE